MGKRQSILLLCLSLLLTSLSGCGAGDSAAGDNAHYIPVFGCLGETGSVYEVNGILYYTDYATGENGVLCSKPNCIHEPYSSSNTEPYCEAALPNGNLSVSLLSGNSLYVMTTDFTGTEIYTKQVYGETWVTLLEIPYGFSSGLQRRIYDKKLYFTAASYEHETDITGEEMPALQSFPFLIEVDLDRRTYRTLTEYEDGSSCTDVLFIEGDSLYYETEYPIRDTYETTYRVCIYSLNLNTLESEYLFTTDASHVFLGAHEGTVYTCGTAGLMMLTEDGTWLPACQTDTCTSGYSYEDGILLSVRQDNSASILHYDYKTGKVSDVLALPQNGYLFDVMGDWVLAITENGDIAAVPIEDLLSGRAQYTATWRPY